MSLPLFISNKDIDLSIQVIQSVIEKNKGNYAEAKINPSLNRLLLQIVELKRLVPKEVAEKQ